MTSLPVRISDLGTKELTSPTPVSWLCPLPLSDSPLFYQVGCKYAVIHHIQGTEKSSRSREEKEKEWCASFCFYILMASIPLYLWA